VRDASPEDDWHDPIVLALPRGGVPVAVPVAEKLAAPLDAVIVEKLRAPRRAELAMGAVAGIGDASEVMCHGEVVATYGVADEAFLAARERALIRLRELDQRYRGGRPPPALDGRVAILVDDGIATGSTMVAAARLVRGLGAGRVVVAAPLGARTSCRELARDADDVVCPSQPEPFIAVSLGYLDFSPPSDDDVRAILG
jgi:putative phosphoribosyl transferase